MSNLLYNANGQVLEQNNEIENMADLGKAQDFFNLAGNLKLAGSIRATDFIKDDGKPLDAVTKLALPKNVYYVDNRVGINVEKPLADLEVKGGVKLSNTSPDKKWGGVLTIDSNAEAEGTYMNFMHQGKRAGYIMGDNKGKKLLIQPDNGNNVAIGGNLNADGNINAKAGSYYRAGDHSALQVKNGQNKGAYFWINDDGRDADGGKSTATVRNDAGNMRVQSKGGKGITIQQDSGNITLDGVVNNKDGLVVGPSAWGKYTVFGGHNRESAKGQAQVFATDGNLHLDSSNDRHMYLQFYSGKNVAVGPTGPTEATITVRGRGHDHGTAWFGSEKGPNQSHVHWGPNGDWYVRSAKPEGTVVIQDTAPNGNTNIGSNLNLKGGVSKHNPDRWGTHFPWAGDQKNYIRGDTEIRGDTNQMGILRVATNGGHSDANGEQLTIGTTNESNLRLGRHKDYSWVQSHGSKPLQINPLGNPVYVGTNVASDANGQQLVIGDVNASNLRLGRHTDYSWIQSHGSKPLKINPLGNQVHLSDVGSDNYIMVHRYDASGIPGALKNMGRNPAGMHQVANGNLQAPGCPDLNNWAAVCPSGSVQVGMTHSCNQFYPICKKLN